MDFITPPPYQYDEYSPVLSERAVRVHFEKHHKKYHENLINLIKDTPLEHKTLEEIITSTNSLDVYNNAAQVYNHNLFWLSITPEKQDIIAIINEKFDDFKHTFTNAGLKHFGSGWLWLTWDGQSEMDIVTTPNAKSILGDPDFHQTPLLCIDLWEHSYLYQEEYEADRNAYLTAIVDHLNWQHVDNLLKK